MPPKNARWWLTKDSDQLVINAPAGHIYDLVADLPRMGEWSPECQRVDWTDGSTGPVQGATFVGHNRGGPFQLMRWSRKGRVLVAEPGREFSFITEEGGRESTGWRYLFEAVEGGTRVTESYDVKWIPTWARIVDVPTNRHRELSEGLKHTLQRLKAVSEGAGVSGNQS
jgi:uncharacterized membrane protein